MHRLETAQLASEGRGDDIHNNLAMIERSSPI
jgi:hypothetical protein